MSLQAQPPLPAPPVLTPPSGWLGHLGIKSGGKQPGQVSPYLQPTLDMQRYYMAGGRVVLASPVGGVPAVQNGTAVIYTVPQGHVTLLEQVVATNTAVFGAAAGVTLQIVIDDGVHFFTVGGPSQTGVTGSIVFTSLTTTQTGPILLLPGYRVGVLALAAAAFTAFNIGCGVWGQEVLA